MRPLPLVLVLVRALGKVCVVELVWLRNCGHTSTCNVGPKTPVARTSADGVHAGGGG